MVLRNRHRLKGHINVYLHEELTVADRILRKSALAELAERRAKGEENLRVRGFQVVQSVLPLNLPVFYIKKKS